MKYFGLQFEDLLAKEKATHDYNVMGGMDEIFWSLVRGSAR